MEINSRKTKTKGIVYDARHLKNGRGSKRVSTVFETKEQAKNFLTKIQHDQMQVKLGHHGIQSLSETTFADEAKNWLVEKKDLVSKNWYLRAQNLIEKDLIPQLGARTIDYFGLHNLTEIRGLLRRASRHDSSRTLTNASINRATEVICAVLNTSVKCRRIPYNPFSGYDKLPKDQDEMLFWEQSEAESFLNYLNQKFPKDHEERWIYVVFLVALNCGLRAGEIWGLRPRDIKPESLLLKRQWLESQKEFGPLKGKRTKNQMSDSFRHVPLHQSVRTELLDVMKQRKVHSQETLFYCESLKIKNKKGKTSYLSRWKPGTQGELVRSPRGHRSFVKRFERLQREWGEGPMIRFHDLRHTAITLWVMAGIPLNVIQQMAGHESVTTTMNYVHLLGKSIEDVSRNFVVSASEDGGSNDDATARVKLSVV